MNFWRRENPPLTAATRVVINIWLPRINGNEGTANLFIKAHMNNETNPNTSRIGHVSLETTNKYASWWPNPKNGEQVGIFNVVGAQNSNYEQDCRSENLNDGKNGQPDLKVCLYSLDVGKIEECFNNIENDPQYGYVLAGDKKATRILNDDKGQSCAGLAYELLTVGGILKLSNIHADLKAKWIVVTPDNLAELIKNAKQKELVLYPETQGFPLIPNGYMPAPVPSSNLCVLI